MTYVVIQTDFGGPSGAMAGVCKLVDPSVQVFNLTARVPKFNVKVAGENIHEVLTYWPKGTVFVSGVDPGVGTKRKACVAKTKDGYYVVTPDNGILDVINKTHPIEELREIDETINRYQGNEWSTQSDIFHGRDIFAYCGARLASGKITYEEVGPQYEISEMIPLEK